MANLLAVTARRLCCNFGKHIIDIRYDDYPPVHAFHPERMPIGNGATTSGALPRNPPLTARHWSDDRAGPTSGADSDCLQLDSRSRERQGWHVWEEHAAEGSRSITASAAAPASLATCSIAESDRAKTNRGRVRGPFECGVHCLR
jgi:hypothetical protein